jgi:hypothetical protein
LIEGANERFYEATQSGFYSVEVIINGCTSPVSQLKSVISTSLEDLEEDLKVSIYPNPVSEWLNIESFSVPLSRIVLAGVDGHQSLKEEIIPSNEKKYLYDMSNLPSGVYVIQLFDKKNHFIKADRVIKLAQR